MTISIEAPTMGESITEATIASWVKKEGDKVEEDELIAELETDKINLEVTAPKAGVLTKIFKAEGDTINVGEVMAELDESGSIIKTTTSEAVQDVEKEEVVTSEIVTPSTYPTTSEVATLENGDMPLSPAVKKLIKENSIDVSLIEGSGKDGRLTKGDVLAYLDNPTSVMPSAKKVEEIKTVSVPVQETSKITSTQTLSPQRSDREERVKMSRLRQTIAGRLKTAQNSAAMLTTYNEVDLTAVMELRKLYKDKFEKEQGVKLGFMSFFAKAVIEGLKEWPALNAEIDGDEIVYKNYYNLSVAVSTEKGLVVPVLKDVDKMSFADIEQGIRNFAMKARDGKLKPDDMAGGTYTITNGGTFGSMMSMPILNYPQVGILGMHNIVQRPVVVNGEIVIRPMMYLAMTYDHRIVDGREAVSFVVKIKECLENPSRILLGV
jgi:2-oxoglutarate dehydrogenase E2 component (dihydrolipoamide succinyltransferase)